VRAGEQESNQVPDILPITGCLPDHSSKVGFPTGISCGSPGWGPKKLPDPAAFELSRWRDGRCCMGIPWALLAV